uniref:Mre11 DNA-binding domain-containing protein n=1 Tax=Meloidogyne incognita TaxID=6306 RepID=A0A914N927_MELIC
MHSADLIHGDLTTSNVLVKKKLCTNQETFHVITSGLRYICIEQRKAFEAVIECIDAQTLLMSVHRKQFKLKKIEMKTVRQLIIDELDLNEAEPSAKIAKTTIRQKNMKDEQLIEDKIEQMLESAEIEREPSRPFPPRVRLKVVYSGKWLNIPKTILKTKKNLMKTTKMKKKLEMMRKMKKN